MLPKIKPPGNSAIQARFLRPGPLGRFRSLTQRAGATGFASVEPCQYGMKQAMAVRYDRRLRKGSQSLHGRELPGVGGGGGVQLDLLSGV
jgi:hypothetical protein